MLFNLKTKINGNWIKNKEQMWVQRKLCDELFYTRTYGEKIDSEKAAGGVLSTKKLFKIPRHRRSSEEISNNIIMKYIVNRVSIAVY